VRELQPVSKEASANSPANRLGRVADTPQSVIRIIALPWRVRRIQLADLLRNALPVLALWQSSPSEYLFDEGHIAGIVNLDDRIALFFKSKHAHGYSSMKKAQLL
jgi:hypothetical protein